MQVVVPVSDFHFDARTPLSPPNHLPNKSCFDFHHYRHISAPNSPTSAAAIYAALRESAVNTRGSRRSTVPFDWEERPGTPKSYCGDEKEEEEEEEDDFDFDFALGFSDRHHVKDVLPPQPAVASADELFELGMIRPLKLPPRLYTPVLGEQSPKSPRSSGLLSPLRRGRKQRGKELDPFAVAMVEVTRSRKGSRSLSPFRGTRGDFYTPNKSSPPRLPHTMADSSRRGWKCRIKEFFLFRSSSEGREAREGKNNDVCKFASSSSSSSSFSRLSSSSSSITPADVKSRLGPESGADESPCSSFRSSDSGSARRGAVTPHEMENKENRAAVEMKKTVMPHRQSKFSIRSLTGGKFVFGGNSNRRRS